MSFFVTLHLWRQLLNIDEIGVVFFGSLLWLLIECVTVFEIDAAAVTNLK